LCCKRNEKIDLFKKKEWIYLFVAVALVGTLVFSLSIVGYVDASKIESSIQVLIKKHSKDSLYRINVFFQIVF